MNTDQAIKQDILDEFDRDPQVDSSRIGVTVKDGAVTLTGTVTNYPLKLAADRAAMRVAGVRAVAEEINVKLPSYKDTSDDEIANRIAHVLEWNVAVPDNNIQAEVRAGAVTLKGDVEWRYQSQSVQRQIECVRGVRVVYDAITVRQRVSTKDVQREITRALHRNADVEATKVDVAVSHGTVTVSGNVRALYEKQVVEDAVWAAPGVTQVADKLRVA